VLTNSQVVRRGTTMGIIPGFCLFGKLITHIYEKMIMNIENGSRPMYDCLCVMNEIY